MSRKQKKVLYRIIVSAMLMVLGIMSELIFELHPAVRTCIFLVPYFVIGYDILRKAFKGILKRQVFDENFLMAVATVGAVLLGEYMEAVAVMLFYQIGELFQSIAVGKSRKNIAALMDIRPDYANLLKDGKAQRVDPSEVSVGSEIIVNPGEKVPLDGIVISGKSFVNTSALTGESVPKDANAGDEIFSGSVNMTGVLTLKTTKDFGQSTASKILELVESSAMAKARSERFITRFARVYTPCVCFAALALAVGGPLLKLACGMTADFGVWVHRALTFLVVSCPCALVISVPLSFFGGIGSASSKGVLIKGATYLEALAKAKIAVFDKTGTLTKGSFEVTDIQLAEGFDRETVLRLCAHAESASSHPISQSLVRAYGNELDTKCVGGIQELAGKGVSAKVENKGVLVGNARLMEQENVEFTPVQSGVGTAVYVAVDGKFAASITVSDSVKPTSKSAIERLHKMGVQRTCLLTGDNKSSAEYISKQLGISRVYSELLPADKVEHVEKLMGEKQKGDTLIFAGDGINDAPVLTRADVGIAMGALGSDAAIEAADVVLMDDNPEKIALAVKIAKKTLRIVRQNIIFSLFVKLLCLALTAVGLTNMWLAIFADVGVMVIAVINAARALR